MQGAPDVSLHKYVLLPMLDQFVLWGIFFGNNYDLVLAVCSNPSTFLSVDGSAGQEKSKVYLQVFRKKR